jgi:4-hydroxybenzoate polyprenyltransferase
LISWSAVTAQLEYTTWLLWGATVLWTLGFDTVYAMSDREDDERIGIHSSARFFGRYAAEAVGLFFAGTAILLAVLGLELGLTSWFWLAWAGSVAGWLWHYLKLRPQHPRSMIYGQVFRQNVWLGFLLLGGMLLGH